MSEPTTDPWSHGAYRVVIQRRVSEEEQLSVEAYEPNRERAIATFDAFMSAINAHRLNYNENIVMVTRGKLDQLNQLIEAKAEQIADLDAELTRRNGGQACGAPEDS